MSDTNAKNRPSCDKECHNRSCGPEGCVACSSRESCSCPRAALAGRGNLHCFDWLKDINSQQANQLVEVMFKNTRKSYFLNSSNLHLKVGDAVVVEGSPGQDLGKVTMIGALVQHQMRRANLRSDFEPKRLYRLATTSDIERFNAAKAREHDTMIRSRKIAAELGLKMKIGDVEYQGDGHKAIFYYIADERVDFRKLIRILAETFGIRVEMKQIGARQEAGRIGGIGPCGRPLCCATFMTRFASVGTGAARIQDISMNPQKLAGQCAKLKCCLNFEVDSYVEASKKLPPKDITLLTKDQEYFYFKADILKRTISYTTAKNQPVNLVTVPAARAFEIIALNKRGVKPEQLLQLEDKEQKPAEFVELVGQDSLTRFDKTRRNKKRQGSNTPKDASSAQSHPTRKQRSDKNVIDDNNQKGRGRQQQRPGTQAKKQDKKGEPDNQQTNNNPLPPAQATKGSGRKQRRNKQDKKGGPKSVLPNDKPVSQAALRMAKEKKSEP